MGRGTMAHLTANKVHGVVLCTMLSMISLVTAQDSELRRAKVEGRLRAPGLRGLSPRVQLNGGEYSAAVRADGSFTIPEVPLGSAYLLEVVDRRLIFEQVRVSVLRSGNIRANLVGGRNDAVPYPLFLEAKGAHQYFEVRGGFNFGMIWKNPMMLMMGFSMLMMFMMQKVVDP